MHGPLRLSFALLVNYVAKCQMSCGPYGPIFIFLAARILEHMILNGPVGALEAAQEKCSEEVVGYMKEGIAEKDKPHRDVIKNFGLSCRKFFCYKKFITNYRVSPSVLLVATVATVKSRSRCTIAIVKATSQAIGFCSFL